METAIRIPATLTGVMPPLGERANFFTHGAGLALSIVGMHQLLAATAGRGTVNQVAGTAVFGGTMVLVYLASTLYHAIHDAQLKKRLRVVDHATIYVLIAGTYTPFLLALPAPWSTWVLAAIWTFAIAGVVFKTCFGPGHQRLSMTMYVTLGWIGILTINPLIVRVSCGGVACLLAGGLAYTIGIVFFVRNDLKHSHAVWHVFVVLGSALHYSAVVQYVVPLTFTAYT